MKNVTKIPATKSRFTLEPISEVKKRKVAGYARVSTDQEEQLTSYEAQLDYYTRFIQSHDDWEFAGMYSDEGITGTSTKHREGFNRMVEDALDGKIDLILTKSVSRFARNTVDSLTTIRKLKEHGTEVYFEKENIWSFDGKGEVMLTIMASLAQEESRSISENVTWGHRKRFEDGKVSIAYSSFLGYEKGPDGNLVVNPEQAEIVKRIYGEFLLGYSFNAIAKRLTADGIPTPMGKKVWRQTTVQSILQNEKYKGDALLQKSYTTDFLTKKAVVNHGEVPQYYVENNHEAIIEPAVFDRVQDLIARKHESGKYCAMTIFSMKIQCGDCGGWYGSKVWHSNDKYRRTIWQCNKKYRNKKKCTTPHLTEEEIKALFVKKVNEIISERNVIITGLKTVQKELAGTTALEEKRRELSDELNELADAMNACIEENARVAQNQDDFRARYEEMSTRFEAVKAELDKVSSQVRVAGIQKREIARYIKEVQKLPDIFTEFDEVLWASLVDHITVYSKDDIRFCLRSGQEM